MASCFAASTRRSSSAYTLLGSWMSIIKTLAALHKLDPAKVGLGDFGSTKPFYPRQIKCVARRLSTDQRADCAYPRQIPDQSL